MLKKILIGIVSLIVLLVVVILIQPTRFRIERSATIAASSENIFPHINDLHQWDAWSPWAKLDPSMTTTYEGEPSGKGAIYKWSGNDEVGEGKMTILESQPNQLVRINLEFIRPFPAENLSEFVLTPKGDATDVTWSLSGDRNFMSKAFGLIVDIDKMVGADFEKGLAALKSIAESATGGSSAAPADAAGSEASGDEPSGDEATPAAESAPAGS